MPGTGSLQFSDLPLIEVGVRLSLASPCPFDLLRASRLHARLDERFPLIEDSSEYQQPPGRGINLELVLGRLHAARFVDPGSGLVFTVQQDMVAMRWLVAAGGARAQYPRFGAVVAALEWALERHAGEYPQGSTFDVANVTYVNFLRTQALSVGDILSRYFVPAARPAMLQGSSVFHSVEMEWAEQSVDLQVRIRRGQTNLPDDAAPAPGYAVITAAGMRLDPALPWRQPVDRLHDVLQDLFLSILSDEARAEWGYRGRS